MLKELILNCGSRALMETHAAVFDRYYRSVELSRRRTRSPTPGAARVRLGARRRAGEVVLLDDVNGCVEHALTDGAFR